MKAATLFSGIGAPECAMPEWSWLWHAEIEPFPAAVHAQRIPGSVNLGDVLAPDFLERAAEHDLDVLVGGPPCQAFSVAGLRGGLSDPRGNLSLRWVQILHATRPRYAVTENVPGWLNTPDNAFGCFLGALVGADDALDPPPGAGWPRAGMVAGPLQRAVWRVLDAQHFGLAQRRERVFVVSCPADGADPAEVLFERKGSGRNPAQGRGQGQDVAGTIGASLGGSDGNDAKDGRLVVGTLGSNHGNIKAEHDVCPTCLRERPVVLSQAYGGNNTVGPIDIATAVNAHGGPHGRLDFESETFVTAFHARQDPDSGPLTHPLDTDGYSIAVQDRMSVRRLTPTECARLQGFPDSWCDIAWRGKPVSDGPCYKALGNSMAVPVLRWLLTRIEAHGTEGFASDNLSAAGGLL